MKFRRFKRGEVHFWCPGCDGVHGVNAHWVVTGEGDSLTFSPSLLSTWTNGETDKIEIRCHCYVRGGRIEFLSDCSHPLAGQTVDIPVWPYSE